MKLFFTRERIITVLSFLWLFSLMTGYYIIKPVRETFINELPKETYPYLLISTMLIILLVNFIYDFLARILSSARLIIFMTLCFTIGLSIFPYLLNTKWSSIDLPLLGLQPGHYVCIVFYALFVGVYNLFTVTMFWSFVNEVFNLEEGRKYLGAVTAGGSVGGLLGSKITSYLTSKMPIADLIFIAVILLLLTLIFMWLLLPYRKTVDRKETISSVQAKENGFKMIFHSSYLRWMILAMFLTTSSGTILGYQMNALVKESILEQAKRATFWADMYFLINCLSLGVQILLIRPIISCFGIMTGLLISPLIDFTGACLLGCSQRLSFGSFYFVGRYSSEYSFNRASKEMLFIPTSKGFKYQAKAIVDTFVFRMGDGLVSLLLIFLENYPISYVAFLGIGFNFLRIIPAVVLAREYKDIQNRSR
ncbi:MAG TPA: hypothetical protein PL110_05670 [Candidatus Eremiobacteraeota bacterium]|nr:MAG: TLC ATP/ADP transporter [bacterium ADurb.Bin363]HPZ07581.1 hypothetical protein [Candidatus Eremiobacteraeota bacterium]